jgi:hypothetical protein
VLRQKRLAPIANATNHQPESSSAGRIIAV